MPRTTINQLADQVSQLTKTVNSLAANMNHQSNSSGQDRNKLPEKRELFNFSGKDFVITESENEKGNRLINIKLTTGREIVKRTDKFNADLAQAAADAFQVISDAYKSKKLS